MNSIKTRKQVRFTIIMVLILMIFSLSVISGKTDKTVLTNSETNFNKKKMVAIINMDGII